MAMNEISPDGTWQFNGTEWVPIISPDGQWQWNGTEWVALTVKAKGKGKKELVGVTSRVTVTRLLAGGIVGGLLFPKKTKYYR